jgi:hypothetical protein
MKSSARADLTLKSKENQLRGSRPAVEVLYFCFAKRKYPKKGDPQRVEFPPQPHRPARLNSHRASHGAQTCSRLTPWAARLRRRADGLGLRQVCAPAILKRPNPQPGRIKPGFTFPSFPPHRRALGPVKHADGWPGRGVKRLRLSDLTLANREFRRASHGRGLSGSRRPCLWGGLEVKEGLATQALLPVRRAEAACKTSSA